MIYSNTPSYGNLLNQLSLSKVMKLIMAIN